MNSIERIVSTLKFEKPDRVPVIAQVFGHAAKVAGLNLGEYIQDGELLARGQIKALDRYGYDAVFALMDAYVETEAVGSVLTYFKKRYPVVKCYALSQDTDPDNISVPDPLQAGRMPELLNAAGILREEVGDEVLVVGCVLGPLTVTTQLLGIEKALYLAVDDPERFGRVLDFATDVVIRFGKAQIDAGVHLPVVFDPSASPVVIPPMFFREFELPRLTRLFSSLKEHGATTNWLHIAGPADPILPSYPEAGVDIANFDYSVSPSVAQTALPRTVLDGNIKPWLFVEAAPEEITFESSRLLDQFTHRGGFILSSGCEIPPESRQENVAAMVMAVRMER
jgi:uroporphyrinogen decarboxylase